ncbi:MAG: IS5 family transposase, partial [Hymenobacteraceae bacterium]|nr:IS5 family transposase [Hymenobacteraceae bacterium]
LTDTQWGCIEKELETEMLSRKRLRPLRSIINAIFYISKTGIQWRAMPHDLPPWQTVYYYYRKWSKNGFWQWLHDLLSVKVRVKAGKAATPSTAIMDSQSVKTCFKGARGYDAAKRIKGRKRHLLVDTLGLIIVHLVHRADISERVGAKYLLSRLLKRMVDYPRLKLFFADQGYSGQAMKDWVSRSFRNWKCSLEIVKKIHKKTFKTLPKRWIVERTFGWLNLYRRLSKDYETETTSSETMIQIAMIHIMLKKLSK